MLFLSRADVEDLLDLDELVGALAAARADSRVLAILGTGVLARSHAAALTRARDFDEIRVAGRDREKAEALADEIGGTAAGSWEEALHGADVVAATTHADEPVVRRAWL